MSVEQSNVFQTLFWRSNVYSTWRVSLPLGTANINACFGIPVVRKITCQRAEQQDCEMPNFAVVTFIIERDWAT
jgi:hypothetical protein